MEENRMEHEDEKPASVPYEPPRLEELRPITSTEAPTGIDQESWRVLQERAQIWSAG